MTPPEPSCPTTASFEYANKADTQKGLKINYMKITEVLKEEINKFFKEI